MRPILTGLAVLALVAATSSAWAEGESAPPAPSSPQPQAAPYDPIGDVIDAVNERAVENASGWSLRATLYHGGGGMSGHDSLGCRVAPMRTVAIDPAIVARRSIIFIKETVGMLLPGGGRHDGYWYASDTGGAIHGQKIDLFTGSGEGSMRPLMGLNLKSVTVSKVGDFTGCPPVDGGIGKTTVAAQTALAPALAAAPKASGLDEGPLKNEVARTGDGALIEASSQ
jgi:3D (Asp-Asp-Asp) domain-containing protein